MAGCLRPLHVAVLEKAGLIVVEELLLAYTCAAQVTDGDGNLPLQNASAHDTSFEVICSLLQANPAPSFAANTKGLKPRAYFWMHLSVSHTGLHEHRVIHTDIKSTNILVDSREIGK